MSESQFHSHFTKTDVTSIKLSGNFIFAGIGSVLHVFESNSQQLINRVNIFNGQNICGIVPNEENNILLYGGQHIKLTDNDCECLHILEKTYKILPDWILHAKWMNKNANIATITMHNKLYLLNLDFEIQKQVICEENCILYSAYIYCGAHDDLVVLSGTVFSEILVWMPLKDTSSMVLKRLQGHKGVIFSIEYNHNSGIICSTSDDRSAILWKIENKDILLECSKPTPQITKECQVFGHLSRVFRCQVLDCCFITAGEDSGLNIWSYDGRLLRKLGAYQGDPLWALDSDENKNIIITGSGNGSITIFPINYKFVEEELSLGDNENPKRVGILYNGNLVVISERGNIFHYLQNTKKWTYIQEHSDLKNYVLMEISGCRKLVALAGFEGQIYIYREQCDQLSQFCQYQTKFKSRILSFHWLTCNSFIICQAEGRIELFYIKNNYLYPICDFLLPLGKEMCTTTSISYNNKIIVGDRRGNIYLFEIGKQKVTQTLKRAHNHLGVTKLKLENDKIVSLGRNGIVKTFLIRDRLYLISSDKLPFTWLADITDNLLIAFSSKNFVIWDQKSKRILWEKDCGGGHRSWDLSKVSSYVNLTYIKNKCIVFIKFDLSSVSGIDLISGYHVKEINALKSIKYLDEYVFISGGEDTTLRVSVTKNKCCSYDTVITLKSHLSNIRAITLYRIDGETYLIISAGGRAQIVCWKLEIYNKNNAINCLCSEQHSYYKVIDSKESEMRIMDLRVAEIFEKLVLFCACSDGNINVFFIEFHNLIYHLKLFRNLFHKLKCILKLEIIDILESKILVSMATDGNIMLWNVTDIFSVNDIQPFFHVQNHQSGINSCFYRLQQNDSILILTGGDDNAVVLNYLQFIKHEDVISAKVIDTFIDRSVHCSQVTGSFIDDTFFITASVDQKLAIFSYRIENEKLICKFLSKYISTIADIQGIQCFSNSSTSVEAFIFGKGLEFLNIKTRIK